MSTGTWNESAATWNRLDLPREILDRVLLTPMEDLMVAILRDLLPQLPVVPLLENYTRHRFFAMVRRSPGLGYYDGDRRGLLDFGSVMFHVYTQGDNADMAGAVISEAIRATLQEAVNNAKDYRGLGVLQAAKMLEEPTRKSDWATSTGPVQYADLPKGYERYQTQFEVRVRKSRYDVADTDDVGA